jgi:hypothetical protein
MRRRSRPAIYFYFLSEWCISSTSPQSRRTASSFSRAARSAGSRLTGYDLMLSCWAPQMRSRLTHRFQWRIEYPNSSGGSRPCVRAARRDRLAASRALQWPIRLGRLSSVARSLRSRLLPQAREQHGAPRCRTPDNRHTRIHAHTGLLRTVRPLGFDKLGLDRSHGQPELASAATAPVAQQRRMAERQDAT